LIKGAKLDQNSSDEAYHKVRIEAKKFRYSLELFSSTMEADSHQKLLQALKKIQNLLGEHQDLTVELSYIETLTKEDGQLEKATQKSLKALTPTLEKLKRQQRKKFAKQFKKFAKSRSTFRKMICRY
jgi:CHAD domain-containing protein